MRKDILKISMYITTFLYYAKREKIISEDEYKKLKEFCSDYILEKEKVRNAIKESIK